MTKLTGAYHRPERKSSKQWQSFVTFKKCKFDLGYFTTQDSAHQAYVKAKAYLESLKPEDQHYKHFE